jgi:hypothetical protein
MLHVQRSSTFTPDEVELKVVRWKNARGDSGMELEAELYRNGTRKTALGLG